jgi:Uma2 family endonuclease
MVLTRNGTVLRAIKTMTVSPPKPLTLAEFLNRSCLEESPAWEYINEVAYQKPMPKTRHSILQKRLVNAIDKSTDQYTALPELRCTFGGRSIVPDIAVIDWNRIPINEVGEPEDNFTQAPDWTIEILSPDQRATRVVDNILYCLRHGCQLGWMVDPDDYSILVFAPQREPEVCRGDQQIFVMESIDLSLTAEQVFAWLKINRS